MANEPNGDNWRTDAIASKPIRCLLRAERTTASVTERGHYRPPCGAI